MTVIVIGNEIAVAHGTMPVNSRSCRVVRAARIVARHAIPHDGKILPMTTKA